MTSLQNIVDRFAWALKIADARGPVGRSKTRNYRPGIGPLTENQTITEVVTLLADVAEVLAFKEAKPRRYPGSRKECDLVIPGQWALEFKLLRPYGDNGREAEHWAKNVLYPYPGNTGAIGDCLKLLDSDFPERKAMVVLGYEHSPPELHLEPAIRSFEVIAEIVVGLDLGPRCQASVDGLIHPIHQHANVYAWEVLGRI